MVNANPEARTVHLTIPGAVRGEAKGQVISADPNTENSLDEPLKVSPKEEHVAIPGSESDLELAGNSLTVLRVKTKA
jgi:hypothetical protein